MNESMMIVDPLADAGPNPFAVQPLVFSLGGALSALVVDWLRSVDLVSVEVLPANADQPLLAVVCDPAWALAEAALRGEDLPQRRRQWIDQAKALLLRAQQDPASCSLLLAEEVIQAPSGFVAILPAEVAQALTGTVGPVMPGPCDELTLARIAVERDITLQPLWEELSASCLSLGSVSVESRQPLGFDEVARLLSSQTALRTALRAAHAEQGRQADRLKAALGESSLLQDELQLVRLQWQQAREELGAFVARQAETERRLEATQAAAQGEVSALRAELLRAQETAELARLDALNHRSEAQAQAERHAAEVAEFQVTIRRRDAEVDSERVDLIQSRDALAEQLARSESAVRELRAARDLDAIQWQERVDCITQETKAVEALRDELAAANQSLNDELAASRVAVARLNRDAERLSMETAQAIEARAAANRRLEAQEIQVRRLSDQLTAALESLDEACRSDPGVHSLDVGAIDLIGVRDEVPFRELSLSMTDWTCATGTLEEGVVRLVEHNGQAGLIVFEDRHGRAPLTQWSPNGHEDGRRFMSLFPGEQGPEAPLSRMASVDWRLVNALAHQFCQSLAEDDDGGLRRPWLDIAVRLRGALAAFPDRLRYAAAAADAQRSILMLTDVIQGGRFWSELRLEWRRDGGTGDGRFALLRSPEAEGVPLASWPVGPDGAYAERCELPLGGRREPLALRQWWGGLPLVDQKLITVLMDTLPELVVQVGLPSAFRDDLLSLRVASRKAEQSLRMRRLARRLLGRVVGRP